MIAETKLKELEEIVQRFFEKTDFLVEVKDLFIEKETIFLKLKSEQPKILIGKNGRTLNEIQHLLRMISRKKFLENFFLDVDIDDYKEQKIEYLKEVAQETADRVALIKKEKELEPMSAYERRIIHLELSQRPDIATESVGQDPERRIIIKPKV
jgi:spoIIIJ-associated protein